MQSLSPISAFDTSDTSKPSKPSFSFENLTDNVSATPQEQLISFLKHKNFIHSPEVENVMLSIDRADFTEEHPYLDFSSPGRNHSAMSAPHMHATTLEYLRCYLRQAKKTLEIGSGSGYLTLAFAKMMNDPNAKAYGVEIDKELVQKSIENISKNNEEYIKNGKVIILQGDGNLGLVKYAPFDVIDVGIRMKSVPKGLVAQLALGGRMCVPVQKGKQCVWTIVDKELDGEIRVRDMFEVEFRNFEDREKKGVLGTMAGWFRLKH